MSDEPTIDAQPPVDTPAELLEPLADRAYILCHFADESSIYKSWLDQLPIPWEVVSGYTTDWLPPEDAAIIITHMHYSWEELSILRKLNTNFAHLPVLILSDGILEYRNTWEHPDLPEGSMFQPLFGSKLACIGKSQVRSVESWGNPGRCESVGLPRLDSLLTGRPSKIQRKGPFRLLIATANTPAFNDHQRATVVNSLTHLKRIVDANAVINGRPVEVTWRLTSGLDEEIGLPTPDPGKKTALLEMIDQVDAVITTPSTLYLESVLKKRPTAILNFHNTPLYVASAWTISAPAHVRQTLLELESPPEPKMLFQEAMLHDNLECRTPATPRLIQLITTMIEAGRTARKENRDVQLPYRVLNDPEKGFFPVLDSFELNRLYPHNEVFENEDVARLQIELEALTKRLDSAPLEITRLRNQCLNYSKLIAEMQETHESSRALVTKMIDQVAAIKKRNTDLKERYDTQLQRAEEINKRYKVAQVAVQNLKKWKDFHEEKMAADAAGAIEMQADIQAKAELENSDSAPAKPEKGQPNAVAGVAADSKSGQESATAKLRASPDADIRNQAAKDSTLPDAVDGSPATTETDN